MGSKANFLENKLLEHVFSAAYTRPANVYIALFTVAPGETGGGNEVSGSNYSRVAVSTSGGWTVSGNAASNASRIEFPAPSGSWGTIVAFGIFDASSGGNLLYYGSLVSSVSITTGQIPIFESGDIDITED